MYSNSLLYYENTHLDKWHLLHAGDYHKELRDEIAASWDNCYAKGINPHKTGFEILDDEIFEKEKKESSPLFIYSNYLLKEAASIIKNPRVGLALYDSQGRLLKLYYNDPAFSKWADSKGIRPGTLWDEASIGTNAVAMGLNRCAYFRTEGPEHFCKNLADAFICFAPCTTCDPQFYDLSIKPLGGIAAIGPASDGFNDYMPAVFGLSKEIDLHIRFSRTIHEVYEDDKIAVFGVETYKDVHHLIFTSENLKTVLGIPTDIKFYEIVEKVIDSYPENKDFWEIVSAGKKVRDYDLSLSIKGVKQLYTVTTREYGEKRGRTKGILFNITSVKSTASYISKRIGNYAKITFSDILGESNSFLKAVQVAKSVSRIDNNIFILGESGVGKDLFAQAIHNASIKRNKPFIPINCAALPKDLIASEMFGYEHGTFTGSKKGGNMGKFELADGGTLFLDEIGDMPLDLQATLLRVIEEKNFMRLGGNTRIQVDVRIIAATNANVLQLVAQKKFREDLYYRLSTIKINIPPLRDRESDVILLANCFLHDFSIKHNRPNIAFSSEALKLLQTLSWKGNIRELQNFVENAVYLSTEDIISPQYINGYFDLKDDGFSLPPEDKDNRLTLHTRNVASYVSKNDLVEALKTNMYNKRKTADYLGISRPSLYKLLKKYSCT